MSAKKQQRPGDVVCRICGGTATRDKRSPSAGELHLLATGAHQVCGIAEWLRAQWAMGRAA